MRRDGAQFASGNFHREIELAPLANLHDRRLGPAASGKKLRDKFDRLLRGGKADAHGRPLGEMLQPFERKREMRAALVVGDGVNFIHDHRFDTLFRISRLFSAVSRM